MLLFVTQNPKSKFFHQSREQHKYRRYLHSLNLPTSNPENHEEILETVATSAPVQPQVTPTVHQLYKVSTFLGILMVSMAENAKVKTRKKRRYRSTKKRNRTKKEKKRKQGNGRQWVGNLNKSHFIIFRRALKNLNTLRQA